MADMIGASIGDLNESSVRIKQWVTVGRESGTTVVGTVDRSVANLRAETTQAQQTCLQSIDGMVTELKGFVAMLSGAQYVGQNADTARQAATDMDAKAQQTAADMTAAFDEFRVQIDTLAESLTEIATSYDTYAQNAAESGDSFGQALDLQRENLEAAMSGMTYGG
ncbi:MAG: hypothetical protein AAGA93_05890 [Actinomycetota bacterium]